MTVVDILNAKEPGDVYSCFTDKNAIKKEYIKLLKEFHPDKHGGLDMYNEATIKITELYEKALVLIEKGLWKKENALMLKGADGKTYSLKYDTFHDFGLGTLYIGRTTLMYIFNLKYKSFRDNGLKNIKELKFANADMEKEFKKYIPNIICEFESLDGNYVVVMKKESDVFSLRDVLDYYDGKLSPRHVMWILSSLYNNECFLQFNNLTNNGLTIDSYFISPKNHSGHMFGGWWYSTKNGDKMIGLPKELFDILPLKQKESKCSSYRLDLESIRLIGRTLLGDKTGMLLDKDSSIPTPLIEWLKGVSTDNPFEEYENWNKVIDKCYEKRKFEIMDLDEKKLYEKLGGR